MFYVGSLRVGANSHLRISEFHTLAVRNGITLGENASLTISLKQGEKIDASEFGSSSQFTLARREALTLASGSKLTLSNADSFNLDAKGFVAKNASMELDVASSALSYELYNEGTTTFKGNVHNVGQTSNGIGLATASIINMEGTIHITGNLTNGDSSNINGGGGALINYGGTIDITGALINESATFVDQKASSSVQIYGGRLKVAGGMQNRADATLILGAHKGEMGTIEGNVDNNGKVEIDIKGASLGTHQFVTGNLTGTGKVQISDSGNKNTLIDKDIKGNSLTLTKNNAAVETFLAELDHSQSEIIKELDASMQTAQHNQTIYTYGDTTYLSNLSRNINTSAYSILKAQPLNIWNALQNTLAPILYENPTSPLSFGIAPFASNASSDTLSTPLYGASANASLSGGAHTLRAFLTYANGKSSDTTTNSQTSFNAHSFLTGIHHSVTLPLAQVSLLAYYGYSSQSTQRVLDIDHTPSNADSAYQELGLQGSIGRPFSSGRWLVKPFVGLDYALGIQGAFRESGPSSLSKLSSSTQASHLLQLTLGTQIHYLLSYQHRVFAGAQIHQALLSPSLSVEFGSSKLSFHSPSSLGYTFHIGGSMPIHRHITASIYGLYAHSVRDFNTLSGSFNLSYSF